MDQMDLSMKLLGKAEQSYLIEEGLRYSRRTKKKFNQLKKKY